jgi:glycosyltransferase involved in cell wall biosynthesis
MRLAKRTATAVLQPDPQILWYPGAVRLGKRLLKEKSFDAVLATAPPFSAFLVGTALARFAKIPLIVDYRDEWTMCNKYLENQSLGPLGLRVQRRMEHRVLRAASAVIATTELSAQSLRESCQVAKSSADVQWIFNGYDPDDFTDVKSPAVDRNHFQLVYTGTLWNLTSAWPLYEGVRRLANEHPQLAEHLELVFAGRRIGSQVECLESIRKLPCKLMTYDYLDHSKAIELLHGDGSNCLLLSDVPGAERVVPAKLFEYMASRRPILAILPQGETWNLLDQYSSTHRFVPSDITGIANWLATQLRHHLDGRSSPPADAPPSCFNREYQTEQLAEILDNCTIGKKRVAFR